MRWIYQLLLFWILFQNKTPVVGGFFRAMNLVHIVFLDRNQHGKAVYCSLPHIWIFK